MNILPVFKFGLLNGWLFLLPLLAIHIITGIVFSKRKTEGQPVIYIMFLFGVLHIFPIFIPIRYAPVWFSFGIVIYNIGLIVILSAVIGFALNPINEPVSGGIFRYSRNPMYLGAFLLFLGIGLITLSWLYILMIIIWIVLIHFIDLPLEEAECLKKYGQEYKNYLNRTPKWLGFPV